MKERMQEKTKDSADERVVVDRLDSFLCAAELMTGIRSRGAAGLCRLSLKPARPSHHPRRSAGIWLHLV